MISKTRGDTVYILRYQFTNAVTRGAQDQWYVAGVFMTHEAAVARATRDGQAADQFSVSNTILF